MGIVCLNSADRHKIQVLKCEYNNKDADNNLNILSD